MVFGLARAAEAEPEAAEELLNHIVRIGGIEGAEALVEMRRERVGEFGNWAAQYARDKLGNWLSGHRVDDDGRYALCEALIDELAPEGTRKPTLRDQLDQALRAFAERDARTALSAAQEIFQQAQQKVSELEQQKDADRESRRAGFRALRELDSALLETATLADLLMIGASGKEPQAATAPLGDLFQRLTNSLLQEREQADRRGRRGRSPDPAAAAHADAVAPRRRRRQLRRGSDRPAPRAAGRAWRVYCSRARATTHLRRCAGSCARPRRARSTR